MCMLLSSLKNTSKSKTYYYYKKKRIVITNKYYCQQLHVGRQTLSNIFLFVITYYFIVNFT